MFKFQLPYTTVDNTPTWVEIWYNRSERMYVAQLMTDEGNEVESHYCTKAGAEMFEKEWETKHNIVHSYSLKKRREHRKRIKSQ